ncbi:signal transduction histidine kinase [Podospora fimiseda]|uniref:Signal transduction histidine kinase n=1 Tax=Podospora fimiseda TaxID=252190 RepID=A0AAN7BEQ3_9PEZI|nr:signal transduction histidine kinase [Podospora fimiseda]
MSRLDDDVIYDMPDFGDHVDNGIFSQILEMDESDSDRDFSMPLVSNFFEQASETFIKMDKALVDVDLRNLSDLGHFLKGSSATLGFNKIRDSCQIIQQYGNGFNIDGSQQVDEDTSIKKIQEAITKVKLDTAELEKLMRKFFGY